MASNPLRHVAYLGTLAIEDQVYIGHLFDHPEVGPDAYSMSVRSVDAEGNQMVATMRGRFGQFDTAVTWALLQMLEYMLSVGIDIGDLVTVHPASVPGLDLDQVCLAIVAEAQRIREESAGATKH
ncbi:hypothetical protein [Variovorax paradoxus]|uniref:hypothetical protein n=1 Tax=Variovorax paradoxus TaxID=34073 RepID=UPI002481452D|nr:hypothetical protein [Variovorax paradoxus]WGT66012.1 hypothetical protein QHG62_11945 [Variovorax paradoxus]